MLEDAVEGLEFRVLVLIQELGAFGVSMSLELGSSRHGS